MKTSSTRTTQWFATWSTVTMLAVGLGTTATAQPAETVRFALVIGANDSVDKDLLPLRFADDDAARYYDLMQLVGVPTVLVSDLDRDTARLHPQAAKVAREATGAGLERAVDEVRAAVDTAQQQGKNVEVYVVFAGHGNRNGNQGYLTLSDTRLTGQQFFDDVVLALGADKSHVVIDACYSFLLTYERGPGGRRREVHRFSTLSRLADKNVGVLLSTSSAHRSHEWSAVSSGVFSHGVRSGLYGSADADLDGKVSYRELAAFVFTANQAIENPNYRPQMFVQPTRGGPDDVFLQLSPVVDEHHIALSSGGRYTLETDNGIRLLDVHASSSHPVRLLYPAGRDLFLQPMATAAEASDSAYKIDAQRGVVQLSTLPQSGVRAGARGASAQSFTVLFDDPFSRTTVSEFLFDDVAFPGEPPYVPTPGEALVWSALFPGVGQHLQGRSEAGWVALAAVGGTGLATLTLAGAGTAAYAFSGTQQVGSRNWVWAQRGGFILYGLTLVGGVATAGVWGMQAFHALVLDDE